MRAYCRIWVSVGIDMLPIMPPIMPPPDMVSFIEPDMVLFDMVSLLICRSSRSYRAGLATAPRAATIVHRIVNLNMVNECRRVLIKWIKETVEMVNKMRPYLLMALPPVPAHSAQVTLDMWYDVRQ